MGGFGRAGEVVVVGAVKVFVASASHTGEKKKDKRLTAIEVSVEFSHDESDEKCV